MPYLKRFTLKNNYLYKVFSVIRLHTILKEIKFKESLKKERMGNSKARKNKMTINSREIDPANPKDDTPSKRES